MIRSPLRIPFALAIAALLAACGQKGPLYLPDKPSGVVTRPAASSGAGEAPNTPETADTPAGPANPAPEVGAPASNPATDAARKDKSGQKSPPKN